MKSNMTPIDFSEDREKYEALAESREIGHTRCKHGQAKIEGQELRCPCGAAWAGPQLHKLLNVLKTQQ